VIGSAKASLITHEWKLNFLAQTQRYINTLSSSTTKMRQHWVVWFCWLLFPSLLAIHLGHWWSSGEQVEGCVWLYSSVVLGENFCYLSTIILASFQPCMAHNLVYFTLLPSSDILKVIPLPTVWPATTHPLLSRLILPSQCQPLQKKLSKMAGNFIRGYMNKVKGKEFLYTDWKIRTNNLSHWQAIAF